MKLTGQKQGEIKITEVAKRHGALEGASGCRRVMGATLLFEGLFLLNLPLVNWIEL